MKGFKICCFGLSHKTAPVEVRELFSLSGDKLNHFLIDLGSNDFVDELIVLSTCNRFEVYFTSESNDPFSGIAKFLSNLSGITIPDINRFFYSKEGTEAVRHIFSVASSIDSMIVGEPQIVGQFKDAFRAAKSAGTVGSVSNKLFETALKASKRVRTQTGISRNAVSISFAAVELARKILGELSNRTVTIIGAGKMAELAVKHLVKNGASNVLVVNRTFEKAKKLAGEFGGRALPFDNLSKAIMESDIIISSTASPNPIITKGLVSSILRFKDKPTIFIDIAVPRDIDPNVNSLNNVFLYDIDNLKEIVKLNMEERKRQIGDALKIVDSCVNNFTEWFKSLEIVPVILHVRGKAEAIRKSELEKRLRKLNLTPEQYREVDEATKVIVNKILHTPIVNMKQKVVESKDYVRIFKEVFNLGD